MIKAVILFYQCLSCAIVLRAFYTGINSYCSVVLTVYEFAI